jgi:hypothetical protein
VPKPSKFGSAYRPRGVESIRRPRRVSTVMGLGLFARVYEGAIAGGTATEFANLTSRIADPASLAAAQRSCTEFTARCGSTSGRPRDGLPVKALSLGLGYARQPWVAPPPRRLAASAAGPQPDANSCIDRLGLVDIRVADPPVVSDARVRVTLACDLWPVPSDRRAFSSHVNARPLGVWLVRPTIVHGGNRRWVQRHPEDVAGRPPIRHGRTRDLNSVSFLPAEREYKLICGTSAELRFLSVELLAGIPMEDRGRDNSDQKFVSCLLRP